MLQHSFGVPCTHYFDDFTFLLPEPLACQILGTVEKVFDLLGWPLKKEREDLSPTPEALGVKFDLRRLFVDQPELTVTNTERRATALRESIQKILVEDHLSPMEAAKLRGKLLFANSQAFGRCGALATYHFGQRAEKGGSPPRLDAGVRWSLKWWLDRLTHGVSRTIPFSRRFRPLVLFTDGACEPEPGPSGQVKVS